MAKRTVILCMFYIAEGWNRWRKIRPLSLGTRQQRSPSPNAYPLWLNRHLCHHQSL